MKKYFKILLIGILVCTTSSKLLADDLSPSEVYYRDNIAVNEISAKSPSLRDSEDLGGPGGSGTGGGPFVTAPLEDAIVPILLAGVFYASFLLYRNKTKKTA